MDPKLSLSWDAYQKNICKGLSLLQQRGEFVDMTLAADGHHVKVHQMVLSLVSPFIKDLIASANCSHPIIFLNRVSYATLQAILEYAYTGEVLVPRDSLYEFLDACKVLHIKGLEDESLKETADGALLRLIVDDKEEQANPASPDQVNQFVSGGAKRQKVAIENTQSCDDVTMNKTYISDDALDDYTPAEKSKGVKVKEETYAKAKRKQNLAGSVVQYSLSCQGSIQVILNRYIYRLRHPRKNNEKMYRCAEYNKKACQAYVVTKGDMVLERGCAHNHPYHDKQIIKRVRNGNVFTQYNAAETCAMLNKKTGRDVNRKSDESGDE